MRKVLLVAFFALCISAAQANEIITFQTAHVASETSIKEAEDVISAIYRIEYRKKGLKAEDIEIEITDEVGKALPQRWEKNFEGKDALFVYWTYHVWYRGIHMHCVDHGEITKNTHTCFSRQEVDESEQTTQAKD